MAKSRLIFILILMKEINIREKTNMKEIKIFACNTAEEFAKEICECLKIEMGKVEAYKF